jgi:hypothetical protein
MGKIDAGDRVRVKEKSGWPLPPRRQLAGSEGTVVRWYEAEEVFGKFRDFLCVRLDKSTDGIYDDAKMFFRADDLEKI